MQTRDSQPVPTGKFYSTLYTQFGLFVVALMACCQTSHGALIAYWNFDEPSGTNVFDISANNIITNNAIFGAGAEAPARVSGRLGGALGFTWQVANTPGAGRRAFVPSNPANNFNTNLLLNSPFTISYWYKLDALTPSGQFPGIMRIGSQSAVLPAANVGWGFFRTTGMTYKRGNVQPAVAPTLTVGQWNQLVLSYNGSNSTIAYFNGAPFGAPITTTWSLNNATNMFEMGRMDSFDQATLDDLALWTEPVPPARIRSIYTVPTSLFLDYDIADLRAIWGIFDAGPGASGLVKGRVWTYAATVPGSTVDGDAYIGGESMYVVLGNGRGVSAPATFITGTFSPGGVGIVGTASPTNSLVITNANLLFDLNANTTAGGGINDLLNITGDLSFANTAVFIDPLTPLTGGTYRLVNYSGVKTGSLVISNTSRYTLTLDESTANQINLTVSGTNSSLIWNSASSGAWDLGTLNWSNLLTSVPDKFYQGDAVLFDDSGAFQTNITVNTPVFPRSITVNSSTRPYIFTGAEQIGGASEGITKNGTSALVLNTPNTFSGDVRVNAGTLRLGNASALGKTNGQTIIAAGAALDMGGINLAGESVTVQGSGVGGLGAIINTGAALSNNGLRNRVTLLADTTFGGNVRWDIINGRLEGNGFKLTKLGTSEIALINIGDTGLGDIDIVTANGALTFQGNVGMGDPTKTLTVNTNAILSFWANGTNVFNKPVVMNSAIMRNQTSGNTDISTNLGAITINGDAQFLGPSHLALLGVVSGGGNVIKTGGGTLYLGGVNTYSGRTTIASGSGGRIALLGTGSIENSSRVEVPSGTILDSSRLSGGYSVASGQTLVSAGAVHGSLVVPTGGTVLPGVENIAATLTVTNGLTLSGGTLVFDLSAAPTEGSGVNDLVSVGGNLDLSGTSSIIVNPLGLLTIGNNYTLINYAGTLTGNAANLTVINNTHYTFSLSVATANKVILTVTGGAAGELGWYGGTPGAENRWDLQTTPNWSDVLSGQPRTFFGGDIVRFDDFATTNIVDLVGSLTPASIFIESGDPAFNYVFQGSGKLSGNSTLTKVFDAKVTIQNTGVNDYVGPTDIQGGTLQVGTGGTFGNLGSGPITNNATLILTRSDNLTLANTLVGSGNIIKSNANVLILPTGNFGYNGTITAIAGTVRPGASNALGSGVGPTVINSGATLDVNAINLADESVTVAGTGVGGAGAIINGGAGQNNALRFVTLSGNTTVGGANRWDVRAAPTASLSTGGNEYSLTKVGAGQVSIVDAAVDPKLGDINVNTGILSFEVSSGAGNPTNIVTVASNATLQFFNMSVPWNKVAVLNGGQNILNSSGTTIMSGPATISNAVTFNIAGAALTVLGPIGGPGALTKATGAGALWLGGDNTYAGNTTNAAGQLYLGTGGSSGSVRNAIVNNGSLGIYRDDIYTFTNPYSGSGSINIRTLNGTILGNTTMNVPNTVQVGYTNAGKLIIPPGFTGLWTSLYLGDSPSTAGEVVQLGGAVTISGQLRVAHWPANTSIYTMGGGTLTLTATPAGVVNPTGATEVSGVIYVGIDGNGYLVQTGGVLRTHGLVMNGRSALTSYGNFILNGGQCIIGPSGITSGSLDANPPSSYAINLGGGTIGSSGNWTSTLSMTLTGTNGDLTVDTSTFTNTLNGTLSGPAGLVKTGTGGLRLNGTNTFAGTVTVTAGSLGGNGIISGPVIVQSGGTLSPGTSVGVLRVNNTLGLAGNTLIEINKTGSVVTNDRVAGVTTLTYGGTLTVVTSGTALADGDTFPVFGATTYLGSFTATNLPALTAPLVWDLRRLSVDGTISVLAPGPRFSAPARSGNTLTLGGFNGTPGAGYRVLRSANIAAPLTSWTVVETGNFDANGNFSESFTINQVDPQFFYTVVSP